jgi:2-amino-4-hydroxy-6-hydroxymethyldihydropteridine diphosphokinase
MKQAVISLGSNVDKEKNMPLAVALIRERCHLLAVSPVYETLPMGLYDQGNFFNAAVLVETERSPSELKQEVLDWLENTLGRVRQADKNAPRTIDADLTLYGDAVVEYTGHHVPDPDLLRFAHVAVPVADLLPNAAHPETGERLADLAARLTVRAARKFGVQVLWRRPDFDLLSESASAPASPASDSGT